jgi:glucose/arabinose dehydrogenase
MLYVSVGDSGQDLNTGDGQNGNGNARRLDLLNGKILRITPDGAVPSDNPYAGAGSTTCAATGQARSASSGVHADKKGKKHKKAKKRKKRKQRRARRHQNQNPPGGSTCGEIFATGLRNPYRIALDPDDDSGPQRLFINDVGGGAWEEIDDAVAGADYGWNLREGPCKVGSTNDCAPDPRFVDPVHAYPHSTGCRTITGGAFVPNGSNWPAEWRTRYLFADYICDRLFWIDENSPATSHGFATGAGATHLAFGPDGALYYTDLGNGEVRRIVYTP